jgi:hypothetical protein
MHDTPTDKGDAVDLRVLAITFGRIETEMLTAILRRTDPARTYEFLHHRRETADYEHAHRTAVASFEVDGPNPKDAAEIESSGRRWRVLPRQFLAARPWSEAYASVYAVPIEVVIPPLQTYGYISTGTRCV